MKFFFIKTLNSRKMEQPSSVGVLSRIVAAEDQSPASRSHSCIVLLVYHSPLPTKIKRFNFKSTQ